MITDGTKENQYVIPRWLSYREATDSGELAIPLANPILFARDFAADFSSFKSTPTPMLGADLLGLAFLDNRREAPELAKYLANQNSIQAPTRRLIHRILGQASEQPKPALTVNESIRRLKIDLHKFPRNAPKWVDLGRLYTACGQNDSALRALRIATAIAPLDRFCIRSQVRLFLHLHDYDAAYELFRSTPALLKDPWLLAPAASMAALAEKPSPLPRRLNMEVASEVEAFHMSELFEAFGTSELMNGKERSARKAMRAAWKRPNHNVITHAQWVTRHALPGLRGCTQIDFQKSSQAASLECIERGDVKEAKKYLELWKQEEPYSTAPYINESYLECMTERFDAVIAVHDAARTKGLLSGLVINNAAVAFICSNHLEDGAKLLRELKRTGSSVPSFTQQASDGLLELARGNLDRGLACYRAAEELASKESPGSANQVFLNKYMELQRFKHPVEGRDKKRFDDLAKTVSGWHLSQLVRNIDRLSRVRDRASFS